METDTKNSGSARWVRYSLILLIYLYAAASMLAMSSARLPPPVIVAAQIISAALFALIHGAQVYRLRGILVFLAICFVVGNAFENLGIRTGFPFGNYYFTDVMGPKLLNVPLLMGLAYLAIGYTCWVLAQVILSTTRDVPPRVSATPLLAACIMVVWDLAVEPLWSTVGHYWVWRHGGLYFGVPISNFIGWFLINYIIFQLFALYVSKAPITHRVPDVYWRLAVSSYLVVIVAGIGKSTMLIGMPPITDATGTQWKPGYIALASILVSFLLMGTFVFLAARRFALETSDKAILSKKAAGH